MRKLAIILFFVALCNFIFAQKWETTELPSTLKYNLEKKYKNATIEKWKKTNAGVYLVRFKDQNGVSKASEYSEKSKWIKTTSFLNETDVPKQIPASVKELYPKAITVEYQLLESAEEGSYYIVEVITEGTSYELSYSSDGKLLSTNENED